VTAAREVTTTLGADSLLFLAGPAQSSRIRLPLNFGQWCYRRFLKAESSTR
jgi:hypothetical protein